MKKVIVYAFLLIITLPLLLWFISELFGVQVDVELDGYTDSYEKVEFSLETYSDGTLQKSIVEQFEDHMPLRGVMTRSYNTARYELFAMGNRPIGKNGSVFEEAYLYTELAIGDYNYAVPENQKKMQDMVDHMDSIQEKLEEHGKFLYVYIAPSKAGVCYDEMPTDYVALAPKDGINSVDLFEAYISETNVPHMICSDMVEELEYPPFYSTGIHWSRTYEQKATQRIIDDLSSISNKNYRNIELSEVKSSDSSFWRDTDVYDLLNVWGKPEIVYYQYEIEPEDEGDYFPLRILIAGDSFSQGLIRDIEENLTEDSITWINRNQYIGETGGTVYQIENNDWEKVDFQRFLDTNDFVVIEMVDSELINYTYGFVDYLDTYLDTYEPKDISEYIPSELDASGDDWNASMTSGIWGKEDGYAWVKSDCCINLVNKTITEEGIEIAYIIPEQLFITEELVTVEIRINGTLIKKVEYSSAGQDTIVLLSEEYPISSDDVYIISIHSSNSFSPSSISESADDRDLAIQLQYIGGVR